MKPALPAAAAAACALLVGVAACSKTPQRPKEKTTVTVAPVTVASVPFTVTANGTVEPMQSVAVQPQVAGPILEVAFREGEDVRQGQVLFRIDPRPFQAALAQAQAGLIRDRVQAENAAREAERYASLVSKGYVTQSQADQLRAQAAAQRAVVASDEAAVQAAQLNLGYATIRAPISGRTGGLLVKPGNVVRAPNPTPLVEINQLEPVLVRFTVPGRTLADLQRAMGGAGRIGVVATPSEADSSGQSTPQQGSLEFMDNAVDTTTGAITLKARFPNTTHALWPGQFLTVKVDLYQQQNVMTVPAVAVQTGQEGSYVFVVDAQNHARMTPVTVARMAGDVAIVTGGLEPGMKVVTDGQSRLFPGAEVQIRGAGQRRRS